MMTRLLFRAIPFFSCLATLIVLAAFSATALATTYYVRTDGGSAAQCNGKSNAPVSAAPNCAWASPTVALPMGDGQYGYKVPAALIKGGDTLIIASGSYMIGFSETPIAGTQGQSCGKGNPYECTITNIPSGIDASHPTVITGASCSAKPELWGTQRIDTIFSLSGKHDITIACLELTDHSNCISAYQPNSSYACNRNSYPYGPWAGTGIHADHVTNLTLRGLNIHGFAHTGINAGALSGNTMLDDVTIRGNGWLGFDGDLGGNNNQSSNSGTITIQNSSIEWNGCTEDYPSTRIINCWAQQEGGYGDGLGTASTGGNWKIINSQFIGNTSDGLDLLYADGTGSVFLDRVTSKWNAGNQVKVSGNSTIQNSVIVGGCAYLKGWGAMSDGDLCRASGAALSLSVTGPNQTINVLYSTVAGGGDCIINGGTHGGFSSPNKSDVYNYQNNVFLGTYYWRAGRNSCLDWYTDASTNPYTVKYLNNIVWAVKGNVCPSGSICKDPQLTDENLASFNANPLVSSPAVGNASAKGTSVPFDYYDHPRPDTGATIGAVQFRGQPYLGVGGSDCPLPPLNVNGSTVGSPRRSGAAVVSSATRAVQVSPRGELSPVIRMQADQGRQMARPGAATGEQTAPWAPRVVHSRAMQHAARPADSKTPERSAATASTVSMGDAPLPAATLQQRPSRSFLVLAYDWVSASYRKWLAR